MPNRSSQSSSSNAEMSSSSLDCPVTVRKATSECRAAVDETVALLLNTSLLTRLCSALEISSPRLASELSELIEHEGEIPPKRVERNAVVGLRSTGRMDCMGVAQLLSKRRPRMSSTSSEVEVKSWCEGAGDDAAIVVLKREGESKMGEGAKDESDEVGEGGAEAVRRFSDGVVARCCSLPLKWDEWMLLN